MCVRVKYIILYILSSEMGKTNIAHTVVKFCAEIYTLPKKGRIEYTVRDQVLKNESFEITQFECAFLVRYNKIPAFD